MRTTLVLAAMLLTGCTLNPSPEDLAKADYGRPIDQRSAELQAVMVLEAHLVDPESLRTRLNAVRQGWARSRGGIRYGYVLTGEINAKNRMGGYTGYRPVEFLFQNGVLTDAYMTTTEYASGLGTSTRMRRICCP